jgi:CelD/BcsL family acetyltransferase involved in cellulose biosynthesis
MVSAASIDVIDTSAGLEDLRPEWHKLMERAECVTPFQSPEWLIPWWRFFGSGRLFTIACRSGGELIGLAPLFIAGEKVQFIGTGITDHLGLLYEPGAAEIVISTLRDHLLERQADWEFCDLHELSAGSPLLHFGLKNAHVIEQSVCPTLPLSDVSVSARRLRHLQSSRRRLETNGALRFETAEEAIDEYLHALFSLHSIRWQQRGESGVLSESNIRQFHAVVARDFAGRGYVRFHGLRLDGTLIAILYWFQQRGRAYSYLTAFDPAYSAFGPGSLIHYHALEYAAGIGDSECDFLRGAEEYKYRWGAQDRKNYQLVIARDAG